MKKISLFILLFLFTLSFLGCAVKDKQNIIYNKIYNVTIDMAYFQDCITAVGEKCSSGTIGIANYSYNSMISMDYQSVGSGFVYDGWAILEDGSKVSLEEGMQNANQFNYYAITNYHVIESSRKIKVITLNNTSDFIDAQIIVHDKQLDLAIISFSTYYYLPILELGNSDDLTAGQFAIAIGSPAGFEYFNSLTLGIISYSRRYLTDEYGTNLFIQTDVAINPGNSGGPLLDINGKVIGVNTMKLVDETIESMGFAIPINVVKEFIKKNSK